MVARANISAIPYVNSGNLVCKATNNGVVMTDSNGNEITKSISVTVQCRKLDNIKTGVLRK